MKYLNEIINETEILEINYHNIKSSDDTDVIYSIDNNVVCINSKNFYIKYHDVLYPLSDIEIYSDRNNSFILKEKRDIQLFSLFENELNLYYNSIFMNIDNLISYLESVKDSINGNLELINIYILRNRKSYHYIIRKNKKLYEIILLINGEITDKVLIVYFKKSKVFLNVVSYDKYFKNNKNTTMKFKKYKKYSKNYNNSLESILTNKCIIK